ncbi:hypothetical protein ACLOJK_030534 [Asimina triloba]
MAQRSDRPSVPSLLPAALEKRRGILVNTQAESEKKGSEEKRLSTASLLLASDGTGLSETIPNKTSPATPRVSRLTKAPSKSDSNASSPLPNSRLSVDRSPKSVDSKPVAERRSPKVATPDKQQRPLKGSELQAQLATVQEDLKKAKERLATLEKEKDHALEELKEAKRLADEANGKLSEAIVAQKRAEENSEIEKFRADELEQVGIEAAQKREEEWQKELESVRSQHAVDVAALLSATQELQRTKHELTMVTDAKNSAMSHADDAMKIAEINAEKVEVLSAEVSRLKAVLDSKLETESSEATELVKKLNDEVDMLKQEVERTKTVEEELAEKEALIDGLRFEVIEAKKAAAEANELVEEWRRKVEVLEIQVEEASRSEQSVAERLISMTVELEEKKVSLEDAESEISSLRESIESLETSIGKHKGDLEESDHHLEKAKQEAMEMARTVENLKSELQSVKEEKTQALNNEMLAASNVQSLLEEKNKLINDLVASKDEEEKSKKAMESLASALHEVSMEARDAKEKILTNEAELVRAESQIEDMKLVIEATKERYEIMLDEAKEEMHHLEKAVKKVQLESKNAKDELEEKEHDFAIALKKSEEQILAVRNEMERLAEESKVEWEGKELGFLNAIRKSEEEITSIEKEIDRLVKLLKVAEEEAQVSKEDNSRLQDMIKQVESEGRSAKDTAEEVKGENLRLKERLLDKENELQHLAQENDELRAREAAALEKVEELSKLLAEASAKEREENGELSNSEKDYDLLPKMVGFVEDTADEGAAENPKMELPTAQLHEQHGGEDLSRNADITKPKEENGNGTFKEEKNDKEEEEDSVEVDVKTWDNCKLVEKGMSPDHEPDPESFEDELESKIDAESYDQINGLSSETMENGGSSPSKQQQKKKKPLLRKFGSLLKKKSNPK